MYTNVWNKYLPVIRILLKKSVTTEQVLDLNISDFEKAGIGRKSGYKFLVKFKKGKVDSVIINSPLASGLSSLLLQDPAIKEILNHGEYDFSFNRKFQLTITHFPAQEEMEPAKEKEKTSSEGD